MFKRFRRLLPLAVVLGSATLGSVGAIGALASSASAFEIVNQGTNKCLDDTNWSQTVGQHLQLWDCLLPRASHLNQDWTLSKLWETQCAPGT